MFYKRAVNKVRPVDVPFFIFLYQKDGNLKKKGTTVGDEFTPSILHGGGPG